MSLEKALEANTAALLKLVESNDELRHQIFHLNATGFAAVVTPPLSAEAFNAKFDPAPKKPEAAAKPSKATTAQTAAAPASTEAAQPAATSTSLSYDDIKTPFLDLAKRDLAAAQALIAEFGFKTLKDAKPEQYAEILRALTPDSEEGMA